MSNRVSVIVTVLSLLMSGGQLWLAFLSYVSGRKTKNPNETNIYIDRAFTQSFTTNIGYIAPQNSANFASRQNAAKKVIILLRLLPFAFAALMIVFYSRELSALFLSLYVLLASSIVYLFCRSGNMTHGISKGMFSLYVLAIIATIAVAFITLISPGIIHNRLLNGLLIYVYIFDALVLFAVISIEAIQTSMGKRIDYELIILVVIALAFVTIVISGRSGEFSIALSQSFERIFKWVANRLSNF